MRDHLEIHVDTDNRYVNGMQLSINQVNGEGRGHGYRIAGPKYGGHSKSLLRRTLCERDATKIRAMLDAVFPLPKQPTRAELLREIADECDQAGAVYTGRALNDHAAGAFALMETFLRKANEAEYAATPCSPGGCEDGGEPCTTHERLMAHAEGDHELCGPECTRPVTCTCDSEDHTHDGGCPLYDPAAPAEEQPASPTASLLASRCDACRHTLNRHDNKIGCTVPLCVCGRFQPPA